VSHRNVRALTSQITFMSDPLSRSQAGLVRKGRMRTLMKIREIASEAPLSSFESQSNSRAEFGLEAYPC